MAKTATLKTLPKNAPATESLPTPKPVVKKKSGLVRRLMKWLLLPALLTGGGAWYFLQEPAQAEAKPATPSPPVFVALDQFTVNLQPKEEDQYLQVALTIRVADNDAVNTIKLYMPEVRNRILLLLSNKQASDLITSEGKQKLSEEIVVETWKPVATLLPQEKIMSALFTSFVIQ